ncbi:hypothetical protein BH11ACT3_BH11ACT3_23360 [soil metagenome]
MSLRHRRSVTFLAVAVAATLALSACAIPQGDPTQSAEPPTVTATPTPTVVAGPPALDDLVLTADGLGTLVIGQPPAADPATAMVSFDDDICVYEDYGIAVGDPLAGGWAPNAEYGDGSTPTAGIGGVAAFQVLIKDGVLARLDVSHLPIATDGGLRIGDARADVLAAHPSATLVISSPISEVYRVMGTVGVLDIEVAIEDASFAGYWPPSDLNTVLWMRVQPIGTEPYAVAGGENAIFGCGYTP